MLKQMWAFTARMCHSRCDMGQAGAEVHMVDLNGMQCVQLLHADCTACNRQGGARTVDLPARSFHLVCPGVAPPPMNIITFILLKLLCRFQPNFAQQQRPPSTLRGWSQYTCNESKMVDHRPIGKI